MHLLTDRRQVKGKVTIRVKCGAMAAEEDTTMWWSEVDCPKCRPYQFLPVDDEVGGLKMQEVAAVSTPKVRVLRRRSRRSG